MANEEQRRAFADYMGTASPQANQVGPYNPAAAGQQQQPYYNQVGTPTPAPFQYPLGHPAFDAGPQPACPPNQYQGHAGLQGFGSLQAPPAAPTPPAASASLAPGFAGGFSMPPPPRPPGYQPLPRQFAPQAQGQPPAHGQYNPAAWHYNNLPPLPPPPGQDNLAGPMVHQPQAAHDHMIRNQESVQANYHYEFPDPPPLLAQEMQKLEAENNVTVLLCHTCGECGRMRSAGYHRKHPVIPGRPPIVGTCGRCSKKLDKKHRRHRNRRHRSTSLTRIRTCEGGEQCDWPDEDFRIEIRNGGRGRRRDRDDSDVYVIRHRSTSREAPVRKGESRTRLGVRVLQNEERSPPPVLRRKTEVRVRSVSPPSDLRFRRVVEVSPSPPPPRARVLSRQYEEEPPPPVRRSTTRFVYESDEEVPSSADLPPRSPSPVCVHLSHQRGRDDAEARLAAHPAPYRAVRPNHYRHYVREIEEPLDPPPRAPDRGKLKEPRVQFATNSPPPVRREEVEVKIKYPPGRYVEDSPSPPLDELARLRIRRSSDDGRRPPPRERSPPPRPRYRDVEEVLVRRRSPVPAPTRGREFVRASITERSPPPAAVRAPSPQGEEEFTDSGSDEPGELIEVKEWRGYDENGRPTTFVEERRRHFPEERGVRREAPVVGFRDV